MQVSIEVDKNSLAKLKNTFDKIVNGTSYAQKALQESANIVVDESIKNFNSQGYTYGKAWKPLTSATRIDRSRRGYSPARPILVRTGKLKAGARIVSVTRDSAKVQNSVDYAPYHQFGTRKMAQRKILSVTDKINSAINLVFVNYVGRLIRG